MTDFVSRIDRQVCKAEEAARRGAWGYNTRLYFSEIPRIERQWGVKVEVTKKFESMADCNVSWNNAFYPEGLTYQQAWYVSMIQDEMPEVNNFAQRLFLITARA